MRKVEYAKAMNDVKRNCILYPLEMEDDKGKVREWNFFFIFLLIYFKEDEQQITVDEHKENRK